MKIKKYLILVPLVLFFGCSNNQQSNNGSQDMDQPSFSPTVAGYYKPTFIPITISYDQNGLSMSWNVTEVVTPIGAFGIKVKEKIRIANRPLAIPQESAWKSASELNSEYNFQNLETFIPTGKFINLYEDDLLVIINKGGGTSDLFKLKNSSKLKLRLDGKSEIIIEKNYVEIYIKEGDVSVVELVNMGRKELPRAVVPPTTYSSSNIQQRKYENSNFASPTTNYSTGNQTRNNYKNETKGVLTPKGNDIVKTKKESKQEKRAKLNQVKNNKHLTRKERRKQKKEIKNEFKENKKRAKKDRKRKRKNGS